jgi:hypothetical protein
MGEALGVGVGDADGADVDAEVGDRVSVELGVLEDRTDGDVVRDVIGG